MKKWEKKFKKYLASRPNKKSGEKPKGKISPGFFGSCILWKDGEMEKYKESLEVKDGKS